MAKEKPTFVDLNMINMNGRRHVLARKILYLNFGGNANTM